ncbi:MAG TPA: hypothetical protein VJM09_11810 [Sphingobium sp.]|nr:hypothetical protein [Sphingobium sp.]
MKMIIAALVTALGLTTSAHAQSSVTATNRGNGNHILIDQSTANAGTVDIDQIGDGNGISLKQAGIGQGAVMRITGRANQIEAHQQGPGSNMLALTVEGQDNSSRLDQLALAGGSNAMVVGQWGDGNSAQVAQTAYAGGNTLSLQQNGHDNIASLAQNGDGNNLALTQNGDGNSAALSQTGNGLGFALTQSGGASITVTQTAP